MSIPKEHQLECKGCGKTLDMRNPSILSHGWIEDGVIVCYEDKDTIAIPYSGSQKIGEPIFWTPEMKPIHLN